MTMTIHEALAKLKTYDARLESLSMATFVVANRHNNSKIDGEPINEVKTKLEANRQKFDALIINRRKLKNAIAMSNALTKVSINGVEYTIAEAIEEKHFADNRKRYLRSIMRSYETAKNIANNKNALLPDAAAAFVASLNISEKNGSSKDEISAKMKQYTDDNTWELIDPNKIGEWIEQMEKEITDFCENIDFKLSESNATTIIDVDLAAE